MRATRGNQRRAPSSISYEYFRNPNHQRPPTDRQTQANLLWARWIVCMVPPWHGLLHTGSLSYIMAATHMLSSCSLLSRRTASSSPPPPPPPPPPPLPLPLAAYSITNALDEHGMLIMIEWGCFNSTKNALPLLLAFFALASHHCMIGSK